MRSVAHQELEEKTLHNRKKKKDIYALILQGTVDRKIHVSLSIQF